MYFRIRKKLLGTETALTVLEWVLLVLFIAVALVFSMTILAGEVSEKFGDPELRDALRNP